LAQRINSRLQSFEKKFEPQALAAEIQLAVVVSDLKFFDLL
jgi:hypothetical protein